MQSGLPRAVYIQGFCLEGSSSRGVGQTYLNRILWDTGNECVVRILLERILVFFY